MPQPTAVSLANGASPRLGTNRPAGQGGIIVPSVSIPPVGRHRNLSCYVVGTVAIIITVVAITGGKGTSDSGRPGGRHKHLAVRNNNFFARYQPTNFGIV